MNVNKSVYLIGCRAVGKSSVGKKLAEKLSYDFVDTDTLITDKHKQSVAEIVKNKGWHKFREYEKEILLELLQKNQMVAATGGGAILHGKVWGHLKETGSVVWLTADPDILCERIRGDKESEHQRPSLTGKEVCQELEDVMSERSPLYEAAADCIVDTGKVDVDEAVSEIIQYLMGTQ